MRKILAWCLILCLSVSLVNVATAKDAVYRTETEMRAFYESQKDDEFVRDHFVWPSELAFLGTFYSLRIVKNGDNLWLYTFDFVNNEGQSDSALFNIRHYDVDWEKLLGNATLNSQLKFVRLNIDKTEGSMARLNDSVTWGTDQWYVIQRGKFEYIYNSRTLERIVWKHSGMSFSLSIGSWNEEKLQNTFYANLITLEEAPFLEAERLLYNISNLNPVPPEPEKACGGVHIYGTQWDYDDNTHWYPCVCGAKSEQGFHADENQDGACDICAYDPNRETVSDPVEDPVQPTQPPTEPATQPTEPTQPTTAAPTAPPTQPNPAEPDAPSVGLWIGISAAVLAAAAALLLLRKKK